MFQHRTDDEIRRYDLMKLGVFLLLLALLGLTWVATRDAGDGDMATGETATEETAGAGIATPDSGAGMPTATFGAAPVVDVPDEAQPPGGVTLSGTAAPGTQVIILVDGRPAGAAIAGVDGAWSATVELPAGDYTVQAQTVDNVGAVIAQSEPVVLSVGATEETPADLAVPRYDPLTGNYTFDGMATPGDTVILTGGGTVIGSTTADEAGNWTITVAADAIVGDVQLQVVDAAGNVAQQTEPVKLGPRPPVLAPAGGLTVDPATGAVVVPQPGSVTWTGLAEPGASVELLLNGARTAVAVADVAGGWSLPVELGEGAYTAQLNLLDPAGDPLFIGPPFPVVVGAAAVAEATPPAETPPAGATTAPAPTTPGEATTPLPQTGTPAAAQTIADLLAGSATFSTLLSVLDAAEMTDSLAEPGPFTVFAPTNDAFALLPQPVIDGLVANPQALEAVLQYHIARGRYTAADLLIGQPATFNGLLLTITPQGDTLLVNDALVTAPDLVAGNGIVHAIDRILVPPLAPGVRPPVIDTSGVSTFSGTALTIVGTGNPGSTILVELNGEPFGPPATVDAAGNWQVPGDVTPGDYQIVAYMLDDSGALQGIARPVALQVR